jgi:ribonuclease HI/transposase InsO family protein
LVDFVAE